MPNLEVIAGAERVAGLFAAYAESDDVRRLLANGEGRWTSEAVRQFLEASFMMGYVAGHKDGVIAACDLWGT